MATDSRGAAVRPACSRLGLDRRPESRHLLESRYLPVVVGQEVVGQELVLAHQEEVVAGGTAGVVAIDLATGDARLLDPGPYGQRPEDPLRRGVELAPAGDRALAVADGGRQVWLLDLDSGAWHRAADPPQPGRSRYRDGVWAGDRVLFLDNQSPHAYHPGTDEWHPLRPPPRQEQSYSQAGARYLWTGEVALAAGRAYRPGDDRWLRTPPLPLEPEEFVHGHTLAWTGEVLLIFGGARGSCPLDVDCHFPARPMALDGWQYRPLLPG